MFTKPFVGKTADSMRDFVRSIEPAVRARPKNIRSAPSRDRAFDGLSRRPTYLGFARKTRFSAGAGCADLHCNTGR